MNTTVQDEINLYVFAVRAALGDLPESLRDELLEDLPEHLAEVMADGDGSLTERLGSPEAYAADLRGIAGFVGGFPDPPSRTRRLFEVRDQGLVWLRGADVRLGPLFGYARASEFLVLLRPAWWVLRGYLVAMVLAFMLDSSSEPIGLLPRIGGSEVVALLLLGGAILASIWFGRRSTRLSKWPRVSLYAGSVVLVLVALGGFLDADSDTRSTYYTDVNYDNPYSHIEDLFVYDEQGRLITNARIFDQNGEPVRIGNPSCYDEFGNYTDVETLTYPYCASRAPYRMPTASAPGDRTPVDPTTVAPTPVDPADGGRADRDPVEGPGAVPSAGSGVSPSASAATGPSASTPAPSPSS